MERRVSDDLLRRADAGYERLAVHPATFIIEGHVCATGIKSV